MLQRLPIALAQVKVSNTSGNLKIIYKLYILCIEQNKLLKKYTIKLYNRMDTIFMNSKNCKTSDSQRLLANPSDKINLKWSGKYVAFSNLSIYYAWKIIKKSYKNKKFKISAPPQNEEFELPNGSYSISDIQDYFGYILKKTWRKEW